MVPGAVFQRNWFLTPPNDDPRKAASCQTAPRALQPCRAAGAGRDRGGAARRVPGNRGALPTVSSAIWSCRLAWRSVTTSTMIRPMPAGQPPSLEPGGCPASGGLLPRGKDGIVSAGAGRRTRPGLPSQSGHLATWPPCRGTSCHIPMGCGDVTRWPPGQKVATWPPSLSAPLPPGGPARWSRKEGKPKTQTPAE